MSASVCPICKYTNLDSVAECINCGVPLLENSLPKRSMVAAKEQKGPGDTKSVVYPSLKGDRVRATPERQGRRAARSEQSRSVQEGEQGVVPYRESAALAPVRGYENGRENPYEGSRDMQPYYPQPSPFQTRVLEEESVSDYESWKTDPLPWYLPRRRPHLVGRIVSMHNEMEFPDYPNLLRALVDLMSEFLWIAANQPSHKEGERVQVTIVRIRTGEGRLKDARLMGYMRGADLTLGDHVSFWGWRRRGSLMVRTGYNHTSKATISTNMMSMLLPGLILLSLVSALFLFSIYKADIVPFIQSFMHGLWP